MVKIYFLRTGSPDDPKELHHGSLLGGVGMSHGGDNMLAKPVPVKRLSEKCIAQARACLTTVSMATEPKLSTTISEFDICMFSCPCLEAVLWSVALWIPSSIMSIIFLNIWLICSICLSCHFCVFSGFSTFSH